MKRMSNPSISSSVLRHASTLVAHGDHSAAHRLCLVALQNGEAPAQALFLLALIAAEHRNPAKALELADRAVALDKQHLGARNARGPSSRFIGRPKRGPKRRRRRRSIRATAMCWTRWASC